MNAVAFHHFYDVMNHGVVEGLPEDVQIDSMHQRGRAYFVVCLNDKRFAAGEFFDHFHDDHEPDVRAWLARVEN